MRDVLITHNIKDLYDDEIKEGIIDDAYNDLNDDGFFQSQLEADAYFYIMDEKYDGLVKKLEKMQKQKQAEAVEITPKRNLTEDIKIILKGFGLAMLIIFAPFLFISLVIYFVLKNMK